MLLGIIYNINVINVSTLFLENRANDFESNVEAMKVEFQERHIQAQDRLSTLDRQIQEFRSHSEGTTQGVMADTDNIKVHIFRSSIFISFLLK